MALLGAASVSAGWSGRHSLEFEVAPAASFELASGGAIESCPSSSIEQLRSQRSSPVRRTRSQLTVTIWPAFSCADSP
jgi:hypothetical protein